LAQCGLEAGDRIWSLDVRCGHGGWANPIVKRWPSRCLIVIEVRLVRFPKKDLLLQAGFDLEEL